MPLVETLWDRVRTVIEAAPKGRKGVQEAFEGMQKARNKNTYTKWLSPRFSGARPDIRISDLEDLAAALNVPATELLAMNGKAPATAPHQLELPFDSGSRSVTVKLECATKGLIIRPGPD
jgi:hypothetical protein